MYRGKAYEIISAAVPKFKFATHGLALQTKCGVHIGQGTVSACKAQADACAMVNAFYSLTP